MLNKAKTWKTENGKTLAVWVDKNGHIVFTHSDLFAFKPFRFNHRASARTITALSLMSQEVTFSPEQIGVIAGLVGTAGHAILRRSEVDFILQAVQELGIE